MPAFRYQAADARGEVRSGVVEAADADAAVRALARQDLYATSVAAADARAATAAPRFRLGGSRLGRRELGLFTRQLANLLGAGFPLTRALAFAGDHAGNPGLRALAAAIAADLAAGTTLHAALARHHRHFDPLYLGMVAAGEEGGQLAAAFARLAELRERADEARSQVLGALTYPAIVLAATAGAVAVLMLVVIPRFAAMFSDLGTALPLPTRVLLAGSELAIQGWWTVPLLLLAAAALWRQAWSAPAGRDRIERLRDRVPVLGGLLRRTAQARICHTLGLLVQGGVGLVQALGAVRALAGSREREEAVGRAQAAVTAGRPLAEGLAQAGALDPDLVELVRLGEESGALPDMLLRAGALADQEAALALRTLTRVLEPLLVLVMGLVVGGIVAAMLLPIVQLNLGAV